jgi:hypothetical protein
MSSTSSKSGENFNYIQARDWASRVATHLIADVREAVMGALTDTLNSPNLRDRVAQLVRDELGQRERDLIQQVFAERGHSD